MDLLTPVLSYWLWMNYQMGGSLINHLNRIFENFGQFHLKSLVILRLLLIKEDLTWEAYVADHAVPHQCAILDQFPSSLKNESLISLLNTVHSANICRGNFADRYIAMAKIRKGIFTSQEGGTMAYLDQSFA